jgi:hypothetical protein
VPLLRSTYRDFDSPLGAEPSLVPILEPTASAVFGQRGASREDEAALAAYRGQFPEVQATLDAILATGASQGEALAMAAEVHGRDQALPHLLAALYDWAGAFRAPAALYRLDAVAERDPELARMGFLAWGRNRSIQAESENAPHPVNANGNEIWNNDDRGGLTLWARPWLTTLPEGMTLARSLELGDLPIGSLPNRLGVGADLRIKGCPNWDGRIPEGVRVDGKVVTPAHPEPGIPLTAWRALHPNGEATPSSPR